MPQRPPLIHPTVPRSSHPRQVMRDAYVLLGSVRATLAEMLRAVQAGEAGALRGLGAKQGELETALKRAFEAEGRYRDWLDKQRWDEEEREAARGDDGLAEGEIDFDELRRSIGMRLARIRECVADPDEPGARGWPGERG